MKPYRHYKNVSDISKLKVLIEEYYAASFEADRQSQTVILQGECTEVMTAEIMLRGKILIDKYLESLLQSNYHANC